MTAPAFEYPQHQRPADNPFASHRIEGLRFRLPGLSWRDLETRLESCGWRGAIIGPPGSGKTTLLEALADRLGERAIPVRLPGSCHEPLRCAIDQLPPVLDARHLVLLDSAEQLGAVAWQRWRLRVRRAGGLLITAHRPGRLPTVLECRTSVRLLKELVKELSPEDHPRFEPALPALFRDCDGDLRRCLRTLYDVSAGRTPNQPE